jgi:hypothetical protein
MRRAFIALVMLTGMVAVGATPVYAHVPSIKGTCTGIELKATDYDAGKPNKWTATIDGKTQSGTFGATLDKTLVVPQDGATTDWSAHIEGYDGKFPLTESGKVGPCGDKPPPPVDHDWKYAVTCDAVTGTRPNTDSVDSNLRVKNLDTGEVKTFNFHGPDSAPAGPFSYSLRGDYKIPAGWTHIEVQWAQVNGTNYHWQGQLECGKPTPPPTPPQQPPAKVTVTESEVVKCEDETVVKTITTTTIPPVLNEKGDAWVDGKPVVTTKTETRPATKTECPPVVEPPVVVPPVEPPVVTPPPSFPPIVVPPVMTPPKTNPPHVRDDTPGKIGTPESLFVPVERAAAEPAPAPRTLPSAGAPELRTVGVIAIILLAAGLTTVIVVLIRKNDGA